MRPPVSMGRGGRGRMGGGGRGFGRAEGGRGRSGGFRDEGPPNEIIEIGRLAHECESEMVCTISSSVESKIPYFNAGIYLENKRKIGKVDEIFGPIHQVMFTIKPDPGVVAKSFEKDDTFYIGTDKLLPLSRFTSPDKPSGGGRGGGRGGSRGGGGRGFSSPGGRGRSGFGNRGGGFGGRGGGGGRSFSPSGRVGGRTGFSSRGGRGRF